MSKRTRKRIVQKTVAKQQAVATQRAQSPGDKCIVVVRLRGEAGVDYNRRKTLHDMQLTAKYNAVILSENSATRGMLQRAKDYITWGEPDVETIRMLLAERAKVAGVGDLTPQFLKDQLQASSIQELASNLKDGKIAPSMLKKAGVSSRFRLHPPKKGFRRTIKRSYQDRGELGYRGDEINNLLRRMI